MGEALRTAKAHRWKKVVVVVMLAAAAAERSAKGNEGILEILGLVLTHQGKYGRSTYIT